jgi:hypothetical protein
MPPFQSRQRTCRADWSPRNFRIGPRTATGELLLQNAIKRVLQRRNALGVHAVVVEAKDSAAEGFYRKFGFRLCDPKSRQLYLPLGGE